MKLPALSRRRFLAATVALPHALQAIAAPTANSTVYFGCDTAGKARGIYQSTWNALARTLTPSTLAVETPRPSFLAARAGFVYAVNALNSAAATVTAFARQPDNSLRPLNSVSSGGKGPAYISLHPSGRAAYVANYFGGSLSSYDILADGTLSDPISHFQYTGHGPNASRQEAPHAHSAVLSPDARFLLVDDLGLDEIHIYRIDPAHPAQLTPNTPDAWHARPGSGPRHLAFTPDGRHAYNINEIASTLDVLTWDAKTGTLAALGDPASTLAPSFHGVNTAAEVLLSPDGRFLYASNRGEDTIAVFAIHPQSRLLAPLQQISSGGKTPRHITLSPDGRSLLAANQDSSNVAIYARNVASGLLSDTANGIPVPDPMFILFA